MVCMIQNLSTMFFKNLFSTKFSKSYYVNGTKFQDKNKKVKINLYIFLEKWKK